MSISVTCGNVGKDGKPCNATFEVDEKYAGEMIPCQKCRKLVEVPRADESGDDPFFDKQSADDAGPAKTVYDPLADPPPKPEFDLEEQVVAGFESGPEFGLAPLEESTTDEDDLFGDLPAGNDLPTDPTKANSGQPAGDDPSFDEMFDVAPSFSPGATASTDPLEDAPVEASVVDDPLGEVESVAAGDRDFLDDAPQGAGPELNFAPGKPKQSGEGPTKPCEKCGAQMPAHEVVCDKCGWHHLLKQKFEGFIDTGEEPATGFTLWWRENYIDGGSTRGLAILFIGGGSFLFFMCFACIYTGYGAYACLLFCPVFVITAVVAPFIFGYFQGEDAPLHPWNVLLKLLRMWNWPSPNWPFATLKAFTRRDEPFTDDDFADVPDITEIKALDLEGTKITDEALRVLIHMQQLQYLVIRNTALSPKTVKTIRTILARTWVWS